MDALSDVLDSLRLASSLYCRVNISAPWGLDFLASPYAVFHVVERGNCYMRVAGELDPVVLAGGDLIVLPHGTAHQITDNPDSPATVPVQIGETTSLEFQTLEYISEGPVTTLLCGTFELEQHQRHPFLSFLPPVIHIQGKAGQAVDWLDTTMKFLASETELRLPGSETVIKRLADILLIKAVRYWLEQQKGTKNGWLSALADPQMNKALSMIHRCPRQEWSVEGLAKEVAMSRSAFAARFRQLVGVPPLQYLTQWRMQLAATRLAQGERDLRRIAQEVGYASEFALSKAFKRQFGIAPTFYRKAS